jgi:RES domain-containing protein
LSLTAYIKSWDGYAVRHIPDIVGNEVYDFSYCALAKNNRWNVQGEPTLYLAKDKAVAAGKFARHFSENRSQALAKKIQRRQIWRFKVRLNRTLNLCDLKVCKALSLADAPFCFKDKRVSRSTANFLRSSLKVDAIFVPSMVFLDDLSKWCLVIFLENLPQNPTEYLPETQKHGHIEIVQF